eukprot:Awhi_evm1s7603
MNIFDSPLIYEHLKSSNLRYLDKNFFQCINIKTSLMLASISNDDVDKNDAGDGESRKKVAFIEDMVNNHLEFIRRSRNLNVFTSQLDSIFQLGLFKKGTQKKKK